MQDFGNAGGGTSTSAITAGGDQYSVALSETWNGTAWTNSRFKYCQ